MGQDPSELRSQLEETRARVGDEVDALSYKTDVGARVGDFVDEKKEAVTSALREYVRRRRQLSILNLVGQVPIEETYDHKPLRHRKGRA